jgi:hypothetical protein
MEQMEAIRDQQESLAKLHFDLGGKLDPFAPLSEDGECNKFVPGAKFYSEL